MFKRVLIIFIMVATNLCSMAQDIRSDSRYYLEKSKRQKKAAFITMGCSAATLIPGLILLSNTQPGWEHVNWNNALGGSGLVIAGTGFAISSIIFFISSGNNKRRAEQMNVFINRPIPVNTGAVATTLPYSIGVTIPIH